MVQLAERHSGAAFRHKQAVVDLIVPIFAENTAALLIQVKTLCLQKRTCGAADAACTKMLASKVFGDDKFDHNALTAFDSNCVFECIFNWVRSSDS
jgi:hypothetical protein